MKINRKWYATFIAASIYDVTLSYYFISGGAIEGNPVPAYFIDALGAGAGLVVHKSLGVITITSLALAWSVGLKHYYRYSGALSEQEIDKHLNRVCFGMGALFFFIAGSTWLFY